VLGNGPGFAQREAGFFLFANGGGTGDTMRDHEDDEDEDNEDEDEDEDGLSC